MCCCGLDWWVCGVVGVVFSFGYAVVYAGGLVVSSPYICVYVGWVLLVDLTLIVLLLDLYTWFFRCLLRRFCVIVV